jgi:D-glycero-D-manno-heptose 1,7-bisphosphate phosphatase
MTPTIPGIFLDRDNTLIVDRGYTHRVEDFAWIPGATAALKRFHDAGLPLFVVTNQGGVGLGIFTERDLHRFHRFLCAEVERHGAKITDIAVCLHHPNATTPSFQTPCLCRKPAPGMLVQLAERWQIDLARFVMIGDRQSDVQAGLGAGCHSYLFDGDNLDTLAQEVLARHFPHPAV